MLIDAVKNYRVLYDKRHPQHKDNLLKDDLRSKIGAALGMSSIACQKKFKNLKDTFMKQRSLIKSKMKSGVETSDIATIKWRHVDSMMAIMEPVSPEAITEYTEDDGEDHASDPQPAYVGMASQEN
ncbi:uncharacterized protein LOC144120217 [Amblyomma americanum]